MTPSFITIVFEHKAKHDALSTHLERNWENPAGAALRAELDELGIVHFMSIVAIPPDRGGPFVVIELTVDGGVENALHALASALQPRLQELLSIAGVSLGRTSLAAFLIAHHLPLGQGYFGTTGLAFSGTPGMTVKRIREEQALADMIRVELLQPSDPDAPQRAASAADKLKYIRRWLWDKGGTTKWAFVEEPCAWSDPAQGVLNAVEKGVWPAVRDLLWPALPVMAVAPAVAGAGGYLAYRKLRKLENTDQPDPDTEPSDASLLAKIMKQEDRCDQNHLIVLTPMKGSYLRKLSLRIAFFTIGQTAANVFRAGFLNQIGTIHSARWVLLPGGKHLVFFSNYDGSWQSYLEDFINQAHEGLTSVWSNTQGFPRASNLFLDGATDGARFKRWARRNQALTPFWYSAYPTLTNARIRNHAEIRRGIATAHTPEAAELWLAHFGAPSPEPANIKRPEQESISDQLHDWLVGKGKPSSPVPIERGHIPTLAFGGLPDLQYGAAVVMRFRDLEHAQALLASHSASYGDQPGDRVVTIGFTASGLKKLGLPRASLDSFPAAFRHGSALRARLLGDVGLDEPTKWKWGNETQPVDVIFVVHASSPEAVDDIADPLVAENDGANRIDFIPRVAKGEVQYEPFGFADGISQPYVNGLRKPNADVRRDQTIEAGEIVLGYPDGLGSIPPTATVDASSVSGHELTRLDVNLHSLGRNGTYLVARQLEQDVDKFKDFLAREAAKLPNDPAVPGEAKAAQEWLAAKLVGRWRNGSSLVRNPHAPGAETSDDNDFLYGTEDPDGVRCPFGAHIRRANPRDSFEAGSSEALAITNRHRILRVGRSYQKDKKQGLFFMCLNADIERQFEFIQQTWVRSPNFMGLPGEVDPILAQTTSAPNATPNTMTIPTEHGPIKVCGFADFVRVLGSGYFFVPSGPGLNVLCNLHKGPPPIRTNGTPIELERRPPDDRDGPDDAQPTLQAKAPRARHSKNASSTR